MHLREQKSPQDSLTTVAEPESAEGKVQNRAGRDLYLAFVFCAPLNTRLRTKEDSRGWK